MVAKEQGGMGRERDLGLCRRRFSNFVRPLGVAAGSPGDLAGVSVALRRCGVRVPRGLRGDVLEAQPGGRRSGLFVAAITVCGPAGRSRSLAVSEVGSAGQAVAIIGVERVPGRAIRRPLNSRNAGDWRGSGAGSLRSGPEKRLEVQAFHARDCC